MRCIGPSSAAEDNNEEQNQHSPAMLKKTRPTTPTIDDVDDDVMLKSMNGGNAAPERKQDVESDELEWPVDAEMFGAAEIAEMASLLLRMILELCGKQVLRSSIVDVMTHDNAFVIISKWPFSGQYTLHTGTVMSLPCMYCPQFHAATLLLLRDRLPSCSNAALCICRM